MAEIELASAQDVSTTLGVDRDSALALIEAGLLGDTYRTGRRQYVARSKIAALAAWKAAPISRALIVRVKPAVPEEIETKVRKWRGWHAGLSPEDRRRGIAGFWQVADPESWKGCPLVATIAGFVVEVGIIDDHDDYAGGYRFFKLLDAPETTSRRFLGHRYKTIQGGNIVRVE